MEKNKKNEQQQLFTKLTSVGGGGDGECKKERRQLKRQGKKQGVVIWNV